MALPFGHLGIIVPSFQALHLRGVMGVQRPPLAYAYNIHTCTNSCGRAMRRNKTLQAVRDVRNPKQSTQETE
eukprot:509249-Amphidinium_carterae.1